MLRFVPGMYVDELLWIREGETVVIPETKGEYYLENHEFILETYEKDKESEAFTTAIENNGTVAKNFQTNVSLYKESGETIAGQDPELEKVEDYELRVNEPLKFEQFALYQQSYKLGELSEMSFALTNKETNEEFGQMTIDLHNPQDEYTFENGYSVELMSYFPDFEFDENSEPVTKSRVPNNPAFIFKMFSPEHPDGEVSFVAIQQTIEPYGDNDLKMAFKGVDTQNVSALTVRKDLTLPILAIGGLIFMIGVVQGAYWNHRRIWIRRLGDQVLVAGHTNKNWHGLKREITHVFDGSGIQEPIDQSDETTNKKGKEE